MILKFRLSAIFRYAINRYPEEIEKAVTGFTTDTNIEKENIVELINENEGINSLFNEYLTYDHLLPSKMNLISDYYLNNPDNLTGEAYSQLKQVAETQYYDMFEFEKSDGQSMLTLYGYTSGKTYQVHDLALAKELTSPGCFFNRLAKVGGQFVLVGSNPQFYPVVQTKRSKKLFIRQPKLSSKNAIDGFLPITQESVRKPEDISVRAIETKRKQLRQQYEKLITSFPSRLSFEEIVEFVNQEKYTHNFADYIPDLIKKGIPIRLAYGSIEFFNDMWNYFPHQSLKGKSPAEMYAQHQKPAKF